MRRKHKNHQMRPGKVLVSALSILSQLAAIIGTIAVILDTLHRW
ncbi:MAG TPA: hypothetical protein VKG24_10250 [Pseudolabrys sp.]|jgi:hypothetical protein|nr:hypothetical protein [Pseudolabrys sp.]